MSRRRPRSATARTEVLSATPPRGASLPAHAGIFFRAIRIVDGFRIRSRNEWLVVEEHPHCMRVLIAFTTFLAATSVMDTLLFGGMYTRAVVGIVWQIGLGMKLVG